MESSYDYYKLKCVFVPHLNAGFSLTYSLRHDNFPLTSTFVLRIAPSYIYEIFIE
jgi:hypothetical protein